MDQLEPKTVTDPKAWRALAHPIRVDIVQLLTEQAALRATDLAKTLGIETNSASFHLRQLARYGYVEVDDSGHGDSRERWWRSTSRHGFQFQIPDSTDGTGSSSTDLDAARTLLGIMTAQIHTRVDEWARTVLSGADHASDPSETSNHDVALLLTEEELRDFRSEQADLMHRWMALRHEPSDEGVGLLTYRHVGFGWIDRSRLQPEVDQSASDD
ncbi:winged helix-turn-helix domain-containing protein [Rudaeicoccus suwonensis]|uniref:Helix-turn-helix protein n=1 Tax=Rudaeicoccus suwonensis TaxID=657409 RepID=A0A561E8Z8_9MICO|nr:helix-turn-helix domain-containing protein [Rudaeicoccus suwonensis]TWE12076.1 helix-turn-helix protein [Rudaeicoccus suwonensis]